LSNQWSDDVESQPRRVLDVGNCLPDHAAIRSMIQGRFAAEVAQAHGLEDALAALRQQRYDLVLVNRKLDQDYSDGLRVIRAITSDPELRTVPVMMLSNYADQQRKAVDAGAEVGFGKSQLHDPATAERLRGFLA
jgi:two-component system chemotaxis response regulator CheY